MDFIKKAANSMSNKNAQHPGGASPGQPGAAPAGNQDYGDKAAKGFADKFAPGKTNDAQREKGTDFLRKMYEKITKKPVNPKYSN